MSTEPLKQDSYDIAIIGAGPAGMSAAVTACAAGASVVVLDDKPHAGGQIYRGVDHSPLETPDTLGKDYIKGQALTKAFAQSGAEHLRGVNVWHVGDNGEVLLSEQGKTRRLTATQLIIANGAMERPFPIPGWHLPGVMSAGSAQVMLKSDGLVIDDAVFVGTGPLLYLIVAQYIRLGVSVKAVVDTTLKENYLNAAKVGLGAARMPKMLLKGLGLLREIRRAGVPFYRCAEALEVLGGEQATGIRFSAGGQRHEIEASRVFLHQGVIPNLNITRALGLEHHWCEQQLCWKPNLNVWGRSSLAHVAVVGDASGIVGADGAHIMGRIAALMQLESLGFIDKNQRNEQARTGFAQLDSMQRFRTFIDALYRPMDAHRIPQQDATVVCRCEERSVADLKAGFALGGKLPDQLKSQTRCGMGPCQGRMCGHTVSELLGQWNEQPVSEIGYYRLRSPMRLLTLEELGAFSELAPSHANAKPEVQS
ncbi:NAD(P)/FAD-dependent oxidoreductase [Neptunomonas sp. XY-337]|uniref:FAD/NAD(P)-dependent oxidoreductase n=1 Tax=Neptunomonas sp. XY-337 TaxID=2561897 RepID=UPI0010AADC60|nr:NAD(P)/FAD-dependent oxidoreductase [Neptunomonas sp. XY-337]